MREKIVSRYIAVLRSERGAGFVEYALVVSLIAIVSMTGVRVLGGSLTDSFSGSGTAMERGGPVESSKTATYKDEISTTFEVAAGRVYLGAVEADGWTNRVTKDTGRRISVKFTNVDNGDVVRVNGWLNRKDKLKSNVKKKR
jgi:Flp pilus assembly pilin Flp